MRLFLNAATLVLLDLASTILFLIVFLLTHNVRLAVGSASRWASRKSALNSLAEGRSRPWSG
jgi:hypothetical protein